MEAAAVAPAFVIYREGNVLQLELSAEKIKASQDLSFSLGSPILRLCAIDEQQLLLLNSAQQLLYGRYVAEKGEHALHLQVVRDNVRDVDFCRSSRMLYVVDGVGNVYETFIDGSKVCALHWLPVVFDPLELSENGIQIARVKCSLEGVLFVTVSSDIYALGNCGEVFQVESQPQHLRLFEKQQEILDLVAGDEHFALLLRQEPDEHEMDNRLFVPNGAAPSAVMARKSPDRTSSTALTSAEPNVDKHHKRNSSSASANSLLSQTSNSQLSCSQRPILTLQKLLNQGYSLLQTQVHTFGSANGGLLGTGDHIKRADSSIIKKLACIGVCAIAAGREHSIARTLDGRLFHWGLNSKQQLNNNNDCTDLSAPQELKLDSAEMGAMERSILAACCGDYQTLVLNANGSLYVRDVQLKRDLLCVQDASDGNVRKNSIPIFLATGCFTLHNLNKLPLQQQFFAPYSSLQQQLQTLLRHRHIVQALLAFQQKNNSIVIRQMAYVCQCFMKCVYYLVAALHSLERFYRGNMDSAAELLIVRHFGPSIELFRDYTKSYCDVRSINGFAEAAKAYTFFTIPPADVAGTTADCNDLDRVFQQPFQIFPHMVQCLELLSKNRLEFSEQLLAWQSFMRQHRIDLELADNTQEFWLRNERSLKLSPFRRKQRRVILSSETVPLRLANSAYNIVPGTQPYFILFSDCLCQFGTNLQTFPLVAMWLKLENDKAFRVTTPEKSFTLIARSQHDKMLWFDQMESAIAAALGRPGNKVSNGRTMAYVYSAKHSKYAGVDAYGQWRNGMLHGSCFLQFPDEKLYLGEARHGEIEGFGKMVMPSIGVYEGNFKAGKFHGYGCFEMKDNEVYTGHFRDGLFHGHGMLRSNAYTYVGEFQANAKSGYGIQDDAISGEKYMGMFADNKRTGAGTCITMNGDYFEGVFMNDELTGQGLAVFENNNYYEGELTLSGPLGKGSYYMPHSSVEIEPCNLENNDESLKQQMCGTVLSGQLAGNWQEVRIVTGTMAINQQFPKYPKSIGDLVVDNSRKWRSLFDNFEHEVFGYSSAPNNTKELWNRIAVYITTLRERDKTREQQDSAYQSYVQSYFAKNISLGFLANFDKISVKSTNSLMTSAKSSILDLSDEASRLGRRSYSQETLFECDLNDLDLLNSSTLPSNEENSFHNMLNTQLGCWANDSSNSLNSSFDSVTNLSELSRNNSFSGQNGLDFVPHFGMTTLNSDDVAAIKEYLVQAFKDVHHPLYLLNQRIANSFYTSYGCWKVKPTPILAKQAMREWESISKRVYRFVRKMFPALPEDFCVIESTREVVSHITLLYPIVLSEGIYSTLFVLYANKYSDQDEMYRQNLLYAEKLKDIELSECLGLDSVLLPVVSNEFFHIAIQTLKQVQEKYSPKAMLTVIEKCMQLITEAHKLTENENTVILAADSMMPLTLFLVLRAAVPHLGAELALLDDLTGGSNFQIEMNGFAGYCYTTLKASYEHITAAPLQKT